MTEASAQKVDSVTGRVHELPFDRVLGDLDNVKPSVLYADITSDSFKKFHKTISKTAREGKTSYRVRYVPPKVATPVPLTVSGYGVELALKRTDYIVIDDRQAEEEQKDGTVPATQATLTEEEVADLRPLSSSELLRLGLKAASFVLSSDTPFDTLLRLSQDFPKHSGSIAATNVSKDFLQEHRENRETLLPPGFNVLWINGVQIMGRDVDAYSLLEHLRRERKMIGGVRELGLSGPEAIDLLSHEAITASSADQEVQRYDWRDENEGGNVIMWLNDIEKDKRYAEWPGTVNALLVRTYPGQLPSCRRNIHHVVLPVDFSDYKDVAVVVEQVQNFVRRKIPIKFGLIPLFHTQEGEQQAKLVYYLLDRYGLTVALDYLGKSIIGSGRKFGAPQEKFFEAAIVDRTLRSNKEQLPFNDVVTSDEFGARLKGAESYMSRLGAGSTKPPILLNGAPIEHTDDWLQVMSQRVSIDLRIVQQAIFEETMGEDDYLPEIFLAKAVLRRNPIIVPEDDKDIRHLDLGELPFASLHSLSADPDTIERELVHLTVAADFNQPEGFEQLMEALIFKQQHDNVELAVLPTGGSGKVTARLGLDQDGQVSTDKLASLLAVYDMLSSNAKASGADGAESEASKQDTQLNLAARRSVYRQMLNAANEDTTAGGGQRAASLSSAYKTIAAAAGLEANQEALILNGRLVGPFSSNASVEMEDLEALLEYERKKRLLPTALAIDDLQIRDKASSPLAFARISNLIALSQVSDIPEGFFEAAPTLRTDVFKKFNSSHTAIKTGDMSSASVQIVSAIDPASELAQRWVPIIKALSELDGVATILFLNPKDRLEELPVKRFYRYVLDSKPTFSTDGSLESSIARFSGLPAEALLNIGMDLPPSWLVAPKESIHDLDNIKLSAVKPGSDIEAVYELQHVLIEGHSRDTTLSIPPRGTQLVLGTDADSHFADTIVMANLGYFQFKANPGVYRLALQKGRSEEIFQIDSAGTNGYKPRPGDNFTEMALMSFRGATLYPRLSRKPGMEEEDVLEAAKSTLDHFADGADQLLAQVGINGLKASKYMSKAAKLGSSLFAGSDSKQSAGTVEPHADINIFSVASGHLYERMLNIMMVSVMKHTQHTVKFWFIEQFLSPSFKDFLPVLAKEYGFKYEMVTYKWPHWLRGQKEKQREIWGYKILYLDVLFPLDLDKVIFVDADQIVRTDMYELVQHDLQGAPYGFTPMCDSRTEMEGFRFWKQGYWKNFLRGLPYHISALYVVDLKRFRQIAAGDRLRQQYHQLSADPASLSNLDQDLPNHMQMALPIHSLPQDWLWCETWCSDEALKNAKTIDLCNNPQTKEPKLDRARRQVPEWTLYDDEIAALAKKHKDSEAAGKPVAGDAADAGVQGQEEESVQERLQREDAEKERKKQVHVKDEL
ncbi:UDP-glucose,glycoprotein glucosyltransferase [Hortaea werneckii]|nr:UDP-glucose,glycoprotein glucosyltransferase [Hortaea werneckii]